MPIIGKLRALRVAREKRPGQLWRWRRPLSEVTKAGAKSWIYRYWVAERDLVTGEVVLDPATKKNKGRSREMGLGSYITVSLAEARDARWNVASSGKRGSIRSMPERSQATGGAAHVKSLKFKDAVGLYGIPSRRLEK